MLKASGTLVVVIRGQIKNEEIGIRLCETGTITLCGPKVEELYSEILRDMTHACKLNQQSQDQASPVNVPIDEFNCKELGLLDMTLNTNQLNEQCQD